MRKLRSSSGTFNKLSRFPCSGLSWFKSVCCPKYTPTCNPSSVTLCISSLIFIDIFVSFNTHRILPKLGFQTK
jgi:hypothetical protein